MNVRLAAALAFPLLSTLAQADAVPAAARPTVLKAAHLFDGRSGRLVEPGYVVVEGERIRTAGSMAELPANAELIDLGEATLLPGFIDAHTHITERYEADWAKGFYEGTLRFPAEQALYAAQNARITLEAGFTTIRNVGAEDFVDIGLRNAINAGVTVGPTILTAGHAIGSTGGHCDGPPIPPERVPPRGPIEGVCNGPEDCRAAVRYQMKWGADVIKICASGGVLSESDPVDVPQLTPAELEAIMSEAHTWGRKVAAHSHGDRAARLAVEAGVDSIEHGSFLKAPTLELMKQKGTYLVPTRMTQLWVKAKAASYPAKIGAKALAAAAAHDAMMKNAIRIGVPIAFGTDAGVYPHGLNAQEFGDLVDTGLTPAAALMTSSLGAAKLLGIDQDSGTLEAGKYADVVAVRGDVLKNIRSTEAPLFVMRHGQIVLRKSP